MAKHDLEFEVEDETPDPEDAISVLFGSKEAAQAIMPIAEKLEDALSFIRTVAKTRDYFVGYSVVEAIQDRIDRIGKDPSKDEDTTNRVNWRLTEIAKLNSIKFLLLGDGGDASKNGAIFEAKNLKETVKMKMTDDASEGSIGP